MRAVFMSAGCTRKPHVSARFGDRMVYASQSNVVVADADRVLDVLCLDGSVNVVDSRYGMILAGDCSGVGYVIEDEIKKHNFGSSIEAVGFVNEECVVFCTKKATFVYGTKECSVRHQIENREIPTCVVAVDGKIFLGTRKGSIIVFGIDEPEVSHEVREHEDSIQDIKAVKLDGDSYIATSSQDETIKIWKVVEGCLLHIQTLRGHSDWIYGLFWTCEGDLLSSSGDCSIICWKRRGMWENAMRLGGEKTFFNVLMIGDAIIGQSCSGGFYKFQNELEHYISGHNDEISSIDWRGEFILTSSLDMTSRIFYRGLEVGRVQMHGYPLTSARFLNKDDLRFISSAQETILRVYEPTHAFYMSCVYAEDNANGIDAFLDKLSISESKKSLYDFFDKVDDLKPAAVTAELSLTNELLDDFEFETLNEQVLSILRFNETKKVYGHYFEVADVAVSRNFIVSCNKSLLKKFSGIFVWNRSFELVQYIEEHEYGIQRLVFSPDDRYLAAVSKDKTSSVYEVGEEIRLTHRLVDHRRIVWDCCFSHDSKYLATCSRDKSVIVYEAPGFKKAFCMRFDCEVTSVCFSPCGLLLVLGLESGEIVVLEVHDELVVKRRKKEHSKRVTAISFSEDGSMCASGSADGMLKVFLFE